MVRDLTWQTVRLSLATGLDTGSDARASDPRKLDVARDVQYDEDGGAQTRHPFGPTFSSILGGGALSSCRRIAPVNDELVVLTDTALLSWDAEIEKWIPRAVHLGVSTDHRQIFSSTADQIICDRAELNGTVVVTWNEFGTTKVFVAAFSKSTKAVLMTTSVTGSGSRLVALDTK